MRFSKKLTNFSLQVLLLHIDELLQLPALEVCHAKISDLVDEDQVVQVSGRVVERDRVVPAVQHKHVDPGGLQALQRGIDRVEQVTARQANRVDVGRIHGHAHLGDHIHTFSLLAWQIKNENYLSYYWMH